MASLMKRSGIWYAPLLLFASLLLFLRRTECTPSDPYSYLNQQQQSHYPYRYAEDDKSAGKAMPILASHHHGGSEPHVAMVGAQKSDKGYKLPRGSIKHGESSSHASLREAYEETGYSADHLTAHGGTVHGYDHSHSAHSAPVAKQTYGQVYHVSHDAQQYPHENRNVEWQPYSQAVENLHDNVGQQTSLKQARNDIWGKWRRH